MEYALVKWIHILSATLMFGTGLGSAFYKWNADRSCNLAAIAHTNRIVVIADWLFTTPTVIIQPISGFWLMTFLGITMSQPWIITATVLYIIAGACWLPVVWLQIRMRDISQAAHQNNSPLDQTYHRYARQWFGLGVPAFGCMILIYFLMVFKSIPSL
ncbi:MAG: DUF2269 domain-containing protein [Gammaproteobacteria bacterium]|nr:DUF2269 domain-containing protein [Gammaproteobacteria bacterium]